MSDKEPCETAAENAQMQSESNSGEGEQNKHLTLDDLSDEEILDDYRMYRNGSIAQVKNSRYVLDVVTKLLQGNIDTETALLAIWGYGESRIEEIFYDFITLDAYVRRRFPERRLDIHD